MPSIRSLFRATISRPSVKPTARTRLACEAMEDRTLVRQWLAEADADHLDAGSEHGGVLTREGGGRWAAECGPV